MEQWDKIDAVNRMQKYIRNHLGERISLSALARVAGYSPWHTERIFKELTGLTPFSYIRAYRLSKAALVIRDQPKDKTILNVALDYVFDSHEGFTRAFSRQFGVTPKRYQLKPEPIALFMPYQVRDYYVYREKRRIESMDQEKPVRSVFVQVIERPARKALIWRGIQATHYFEYCEEVGCEIWGILTSVKEALYEPAGFWLPADWIKPGTSEYVQGVEVPENYDGKIPDGFDLIDMPPCKMMIFQGEPYADENFEDAISELWSLIDRYDPKLYGFEWADQDGPRFQMEPLGYRGYIEGRPVRTLA
jgi:AraC-like DNA-binding protein